MLQRFVTLVACAALCTPRAIGDDKKHAYIDNGTIRLGVDLESGGSVFYFAQSKTKRNLLNHHDRGRFVQQSYYGDKDGSLWNQKPWRWNPVQGGDWRGKPARLLKRKVTKDSISTTSIPKHWAAGTDVRSARMRQSIELDDAVAHIRYRFDYRGRKDHAARHQELPAVFVDYALPNLVVYDGKKPWTGGRLTRKVPGWPNEKATAIENWAAYVDGDDFGIGVHFPGTSQLTCYRYKGKPGPKGGGCSYFAPVKTMAITSGLRYEYDVYLTIGTVKEIRARFQRLAKARDAAGKGK
jgi:hypothetical protein